MVSGYRECEATSRHHSDHHLLQMLKLILIAAYLLFCFCLEVKYSHSSLDSLQGREASLSLRMIIRFFLLNFVGRWTLAAASAIIR